MTAVPGAGAPYPQVENPRFILWNVLILLGVLLSFPLAVVIPQWASWESGPLERAQNVILLVGCWSALLAAKHLRLPSSKALLGIAALFWLAFFGREIAWGAVFMPPSGMTEWGPKWTSKFLWYRPAVPYVIGAMAVLAAYWFVRYKVWGAALVPLAREYALPVFALAQFVVCMVLSTNAEDHGFYRLQNWYGTQVMVLEELVEICGYLALLLAQTQVIHQLRKQQS